jgi:hypothetical protein
MPGMRFDALNAGCYDKGQLKYVGKVRNHFYRIMRRAMMALLQQLLTAQCPFSDLPEETAYLVFAHPRWDTEMPVLKPLPVTQIEFQDRRRTGIWGIPVSRLRRAKTAARGLETIWPQCTACPIIELPGFVTVRNGESNGEVWFLNQAPEDYWHYKFCVRCDRPASDTLQIPISDAKRLWMCALRLYQDARLSFADPAIGCESHVLLPANSDVFFSDLDH